MPSDRTLTRLGAGKKFVAVACTVACFAAKYAWAKLRGPQHYRILSMSGKRLVSVFDGLPRSPLGSYRYLTARERSCTGLAPSAATVKLTSRHIRGNGRYVPVQASSCGGHYGAFLEHFCTIDCDYIQAYAGGNQYCVGWRTGFWTGCCYTDLQCCNPPGCFENNCIS